MQILQKLQTLPLSAMFAMTMAVAVLVCWIVLVVVRLGARMARLHGPAPLLLKDTLIGATSALFALMMAFTAAGIWNDTVQANTVVQREANALENVVALASSLPMDLKEKVASSIHAYARTVVEADWPAMQRRRQVTDPIYETSDNMLVELINMLALEHQRLTTLPTVAPLLSQIVEARSARLARIALATAGVSVAQWAAMLGIVLCALTAVALCHNHHFGMQVVAMHLYAFAVAAAFFVILAHDRPFIGSISISPGPILHIAGFR